MFNIKNLTTTALSAEATRNLLTKQKENDLSEEEGQDLGVLIKNSETSLDQKKEALAAALAHRINIISEKKEDRDIIFKAGFDDLNKNLKLFDLLSRALVDFIIPSRKLINSMDVESLIISEGKQINFTGDFVSKLNQEIKDLGISVTFHHKQYQCFRFNKVEENALA